MISDRLTNIYVKPSAIHAFHHSLTVDVPHANCLQKAMQPRNTVTVIIIIKEEKKTSEGYCENEFGLHPSSYIKRLKSQINGLA